MEQLHETPFIWVIPNDANRAEDGLDLRDSILEDNRTAASMRAVLREEDPSVLEVLAALAKRAGFQTERSLEDWFLLFLENLGILEHMSGDGCDARFIDNVLTDWMTRNISDTGIGGLFPLRHSPEDQRYIETWDQMSAYIKEEMEEDGFFDS